MPNQPSFCLKKIVKDAPGAVDICESAECLTILKERTTRDGHTKAWADEKHLIIRSTVCCKGRGHLS